MTYRIASISLTALSAAVGRSLAKLPVRCQKTDHSSTGLLWQVWGCNLPRHVIIRTMFGLSGRQLLFLLVFIAILFAATQYGSAYFAAIQFNDFVRQEVKYALTAK